jgi:hypothetical protein
MLGKKEIFASEISDYLFSPHLYSYAQVHAQRSCQRCHGASYVSAAQNTYSKTST